MARRQITADLMVGTDRRTVPKLRDPVNYHIGYVDRFQIIDLLRRHLPRIIFSHDKHNAVRAFIRQKIDILAIPVIIIIRVAENHTPAFSRHASSIARAILAKYTLEISGTINPMVLLCRFTRLTASWFDDNSVPAPSLGSDSLSHPRSYILFH